MRAAEVQTVAVCVNEYRKTSLATRLEFLALKATCDSTSSEHEPPLAALFSAWDAPRAKATPKPA
eukprot:1118313-Pyramimonas_sp.AAC.1